MSEFAYSIKTENGWEIHIPNSVLKNETPVVWNHTSQPAWVAARDQLLKDLEDIFYKENFCSGNSN